MKVLLKYEQMPISFFGDGEWEINVKMHIKKTYLFNLINKVYIKDYTITMFDDIKTHTDHWNKLIDNKTPL